MDEYGHGLCRVDGYLKGLCCSRNGLVTIREWWRNNEAGSNMSCGETVYTVALNVLVE